MKLIKVCCKKVDAGIHDDVKIEKNVSYGKTYWGHRGVYQKELEELSENNSLGSWVRRYYRFYNDGDAPRGIPGVPIGVTTRDLQHNDILKTKVAQALEYWADKKIQEDWKKYSAKKNRQNNK